MSNIHEPGRSRVLQWGMRILIGGAVAAGCARPDETDALGATTQALTGDAGAPLTAPPIKQFVVIAGGPVVLGDRAKVTGGADVGTAMPAGTPFTLTAGHDDQIAVDLFGAAVDLLDRAVAGNVSARQLTAPFAKFKSLSPFSVPPAVPKPGSFAAGSTAISVAAGQTRVLAAGKYAAVTVQGRLTLSGGTYDVASLTVGPDAALTAALPSVLRVAAALTAEDRATLTVATGLSANALRIVVGGTGTNAARFANDDHVKALVLVPGGTLSVQDRMVFSGAAAAQSVVFGNDTGIQFDVGFACSTDAECNDNNACTQDACIAGVCAATPVANGAACSDADACTQTDSCQSGVCVGANPVTCQAGDICHIAGVCNPASGQCSNPAATDGTTCNFGACTAGVCLCDSAHSGPDCDIANTELIFDDNQGAFLSSDTVPTNMTYAYAMLDGDLPTALGDDRTVIFTAGAQPPGQEVVVYDFPYGFGPDDQGGANGGPSDVIVGNWGCLPTHFVSLSAAPGQTVTATGVSATHTVRYVHGTCRASLPFQTLFDVASSSVLTQVQQKVDQFNSSQGFDLASLNFDFDLAEPQFQSEFTTNNMGILFEASYFVNVGPLFVNVLIDPAYSFGVRPADGLLKITSIAQNVAAINDTFGVKEQVQNGLKDTSLLEDLVNGPLTIQLATLASSLGAPPGFIPTSCTTPTVNE